MKSYRIPCHWEVYGYLDIDAASIYEALEIAEAEGTPLPEESSYVAGSFMVDRDGIRFDEEKRSTEQQPIETKI